jgi:hypothetical protein
MHLLPTNIPRQALLEAEPVAERTIHRRFRNTSGNQEPMLFGGFFALGPAVFGRRFWGLRVSIQN